MYVLLFKKQKGRQSITHEVVFNSERCPDGETVGLASGYISLTNIIFIKENIFVTIESKKGEITFYNTETKLNLFHKMQMPLSGDEKFSEVKCKVDGKQLQIGFSLYTYEDNYPNCDGEYDRWTKIISGFDYLCYDFEKNCIME